MKLVDLIFVSGLLSLLLCACSASQIGNDEPFLQSSGVMGVERISPDNVGGVILLRNLEISAYQRGDLSQCSLDFSPDGQLLVGACGLNPVPVWDLDSGEVLHSLYTSDTVQIVSCVFNPDGKSIACGGFDNIITLWDAASGEKLGELGPLPSPIWELAFSPDGQRIAAATFSDDIQLWETNTGLMIWSTSSIKGVLSVAHSPSGDSIVYGTRLMKRAGILDAVSGEILAVLTEAPNNVGDIEVSTGGALIAAGCDDNGIYLWNAGDHALSGTLTGHAGYVNGVSFNPDGSLLASGSHDKTVGIWDVGGQMQLASLPGHTQAVLRVEFNPDGTLIASISWDGTVKLWGIKSGD